ncbi:MAG: chorismate lyase [Pseudohongiella sp.]|uniref:chorismate--pyruvate lyase family protein n=1 Tax=Pseudohongiella sp. TaxID=1979412 RepID=UPI0034A02742
MTDKEFSGYRADADVTWRRVGQHWPRPSQTWRQCLLDPGSLTQRLQTLSNGHFKVQVLDEGWIYGSPHTLPIFGSRKATQLMWSRRVLLCGYDQPWVAAHSLIPISSVQGSLRQLLWLRDRPLGGFLFRHPHLRRDEPELVRMDECWGRRSVFHLEGKSLLVAEFFLPELIRQIQNQQNAFNTTGLRP